MAETLRPSREAPSYTIEDLSLRTHTRNALRWCQRKQDINPLTLSDAQLLRQYNFGRVALRDLREAERAYWIRQHAPDPWDNHPLFAEP